MKKILVSSVLALLLVLPAQAAPDYRVSNVAFSDSTPSVGKTISVFVTTQNAGSAASANSVTSFAGPYQEFRVPALNGNASVTHAASFTCNAAGTFYFTAQADAKDDVDESNEGNNARTVSIYCAPAVSIASATTPTPTPRASSPSPTRLPTPLLSATPVSTPKPTPQPRKADYQVSMAFSSSHPKTGEMVAIYVTTRNAGRSAGTRSSSTRFTLPSSLFPSFFIVSALQANQSVTNASSFRCPNVGRYSFIAEADYFNEVNESNESNNRQTVYVSCAPSAAASKNAEPSGSGLSAYAVLVPPEQEQLFRNMFAWTAALAVAVASAWFFYDKRKKKMIRVPASSHRQRWKKR